VLGAAKDRKLRIWRFWRGEGSVEKRASRLLYCAATVARSGESKIVEIID
jgi:hypothetical protein